MSDPNEQEWKQCFFAALAGKGGDADAARLAADKALATIVERWPRDRVVYTRDQVTTMQLELLTRVRQFVSHAAMSVDDLKREGRYDAASAVVAFVQFTHAEFHETTSPDRMRYEIPRIELGRPLLWPKREQDRLDNDSAYMLRAIHERALAEAVRNAVPYQPDVVTTEKYEKEISLRDVVIGDCVRALDWCSRSPEFVPGGTRASAWKRVVLPAINAGRFVLGLDSLTANAYTHLSETAENAPTERGGATLAFIGIGTDPRAPTVVDGPCAGLLDAAREAVAAYNDPNGLNASGGKARMAAAMEALAKVCGVRS